MRRLFWSALALVACEDLIVGTETGNPNPRMSDTEDMLPTMPTGRPVDVVDMPVEPGTDEPGSNEGGTGSVGAMPSVSGSAPIAEPGGMGPGTVPPPGGTPSVGAAGAGGTPGSIPGAFGGGSATSPDSCFSQCGNQAAASVAPLSQPAPMPEPFALAECVGGSCTCTTATGVATSLSLNGDCALPGRSRNCLIASTELAACDESVADSCDASCALAEEALTADAAQVHEVAVDSWECGTGNCAYVVKIDGQCYASFSTEPTACAGETLLPMDVADAGAQ